VQKAIADSPTAPLSVAVPVTVAVVEGNEQLAPERPFQSQSQSQLAVPVGNRGGFVRPAQMADLCHSNNHRMPFQFKQFSVSQEKAAMKVGTDGVLLGSWATVDHRPNTILDIGAGTGLIALMLAQRSDASQIDGIEIDDDAYEECVGNFEESPWNDRLFCYHASLDDLMEDLEDETYDLIVSNPPFYSAGFSSGDEKRDTARQNASMPFGDLCEAASLLLSEDGVFCVVIPFSEEANFCSLAAGNDLFPFHITRVKGMPDTHVKRSLIAFRHGRQSVFEDELVIETERHVYTPDYVALTKEFFLNF